MSFNLFCGERSDAAASPWDGADDVPELHLVSSSHPILIPAVMSSLELTGEVVDASVSQLRVLSWPSNTWVEDWLRELGDAAGAPLRDYLVTSGLKVVARDPSGVRARRSEKWRVPRCRGCR
jgi:hypothetical protein